VLLAAAVAAAAVALTTADHDRALWALTVLKVLLGAILGSSGVLAAVIHLHQSRATSLLTI
jgi:hypothetical protein